MRVDLIKTKFLNWTEQRVEWSTYPRMSCPQPRNCNVSHRELMNANADFCGRECGRWNVSTMVSPETHEHDDASWSWWQRQKARVSVVFFARWALDFAKAQRVVFPLYQSGTSLKQPGFGYQGCSARFCFASVLKHGFFVTVIVNQKHWWSAAICFK